MRADPDSPAPAAPGHISHAFAPAITRRAQSHYLDAYRGACALAVLLTHWILWCNFRPTGEFERLVHDSLTAGYDLFCTVAWKAGGQHPAVLAFFVLSGFCIHSSHLNRTTDGRADWKDYAIRRGRRILPIYWWSTLLGIGLVVLQTIWPSNNPMLQVHTAGGLPELLLRLIGLQALVPVDVIWGNWTLNTVSSEIALYMLYPFLLLAWRRAGWSMVVVLLIAAQIWGVTLGPKVSPYWLVNTPLLMGLPWFAGALGAEWHHRNSGRRVRVWIPLLAWALFWILRETPPFWGRYLFLQNARCLAFATLLLWLLGRERSSAFASRGKSLRFLCGVGRSSYSLYAVHTPVMMTVTWALGVFPLLRSNLLQLACTLGATAVVTALSYRFIEQPALRPRPAKKDPAPSADREPVPQPASAISD